MRPIFKPNENIKVESRFILYPYWIFHLRLFYKRIGMKDRTFDYFAYIDAYRYGAERGDGFIDVEEWDVDERLLMDYLVDFEEAKQKAIESAIIWGNSRVISWWYPRVEVVRWEKAYKVFWITENKIIDSLTGDEYDVEVLRKVYKSTNNNPK
ncbi:hypothetical protein [Pyrococcus sp. ST04]|uniref:hypothetical protein n=1 Tax=Pyrococcus sp. ST04 TaxID=1183377 RepID=UPI0002605AF3|nr:hypothetical protein Py04_1224 [Pyrococcus sp. ST04]